MYHECYGKTERARELYGQLPTTARAFSEPELERDLAQASRVCPQGIDIAARLRRAREVLG